MCIWYCTILGLMMYFLGRIKLVDTTSLQHRIQRSVSACWPLHRIHKGCRLTTPLLHSMVQLSHSIKALHLACFVILHTKMRSMSACWPLHCIHKGCRLTTPLLHCVVQLGHSTEALHLVCFVILHRKMRP